ncbi:efflux RND transporter permease subunit [Henriciella aquimarina]|uniref:efflux RND transporter permease subunit n=1 Tax=Henriciella aquimarina TaxID=545261 RepID=UPI000A028520|nr:efflux RND transporter permease subunit [Henriciella aquimarina]
MRTLFYRLPRLTILFVLVAIAGGLGSILTLGRQEDPTLVERYGYVLTTLPGADAERVEATVTDPIESAIMELPEVEEIQSVSRANVSQISLRIDESLSEAEVDDAWTLIRGQVDKARSDLPDTASTPDVRRLYIGASTLLVGLVWEGEGEPELAVMTRYARNLSDRFQNLAGTEETQTFGLPEEEVRVVIDPEALAAAGLSMPDAARLIAAADAKVPAGQVRGEQSNVGLEVGGSFDSIARIRAVPLVQREDGSALRVGDIAEVQKGIEDPATVMNFTDNKRSVMVAAFIQPHERVDQWAETARALVAEFEENSPAEIDVRILYDQSVYTEARLNGLAQNLLYSALIVFLVLFLVMGWRAAFVVGTALPLTVALVLILFNFFQFPLHQMSVTGLVISLGLLIDNAIVVYDEYDQERGRGHSILEAIDIALGKLFGPLFASTLTTALAFAPIAFMPGSTGEFIGMVGASVIFSVSMSFLIAMTVIPALSGWFDRPRAPGQKKNWLRDGISIDAVTDGYRWTVGTVLRYPLLGVLIGVVPTVAGFMLGGSLPLQFFPQTERDQFQVEISLPPSATIHEARRASERATEILYTYPHVEMVNFTLGEAAPRVYYNSFNNTQGVPGFAAGWVQLKDNLSTRIMVRDIQDTLREEFPEAQVLALPFEQGPPVDAPIEFFIRGNNLETLNALGNESRRVLAGVPGVTYTQASLQLGAPVVTIRADEAATAMSGERLVQLANDLRAELEGVPAGSILEGIEEVPVRVIAPEARRSELADLRAKTIGNGRGGAGGAPIATLGEITLDPQTAVITRLDGRRVNQIYGFTEPYSLPSPIMANFQAALEASGFEPPPGYDIIVAGEAESRSDAMANLMSLTIPLVLIMTGAVALVFNSFRMALLILLTGGMSVGLAFGGVWMFNLPMGFNAIIGALGLLGISINSSIVVLSLLQGDRAARNDDVIAQREVVVGATRHIVATTLTTMGGFVPIILTGDVFWLPLATAVAGGVAGSALLALYFAPAVYRIMTMKPMRRLWRMARGRGWRHPNAQPAE